MKSINGGGFIRTGMAGAAGIALSQAVIPPVVQVAEEDIIYRTLGRRGL
jgi:hypothetical protein